MSLTNQEALANAYGFRVDWPEWHDHAAIRTTPADGRRDAAVAFLERFLASKSRGACLTIEASSTEKYVDRRFANFSFNVSGSFEPSPQCNKIPLVLSLSFDRRGWPILLDRSMEVLTVGLKQVDLQLYQNSKSAKIVPSDLECHSDNERNFRGSLEGLSTWWVIAVAASDAQWLMGKRLRNDGADCVCEGFRAGDKIRAVMTARVSDCFVKVTGEPFDGASKAKILFIEHLHKLAVLDGTEAVLGEQTLTVVDRS